MWMWRRKKTGSSCGLGLTYCGVFTIEEGVMSQEDILKYLKNLFDKDWLWQLKQLDEFRFLVRFVINNMHAILLSLEW